jgi:hypothetical protein
MAKEVSEDKFIKIAEDAKSEEFKVLGDRVQKGELKHHHYAVDGNKSYHHYLIIK